jgi:hypothetical protein
MVILSTIDLRESKRAWARDHFDTNSRDNHETFDGKLRPLDTILRNGAIRSEET